MDPFEIDGTTIVSSLEDICMDRYAPGGTLRSKHLGHHVMSARNGWAMVLIGVQDYRKGAWEYPRYVLTRWRKRGKLWDLQTTFRFTGEALDSLVDCSRELMTHCYDAALERFQCKDE